MERRTIDIVEADVREGLARVRERLDAAAVRSGRTPDDVRILAAVKYVTPDATRTLVDAGIVHLAENRLEQLVARQDSSAIPAVAPVTWHYIGRLQSRQAVDIASRVDMIHTLCTERAARRLEQGWSTIDGARPGADRPALLVQVNASGDPAKDGLPPEQVEQFLETLPDSISVSGFMTMPAFATDPERSRPAFAALRTLRDTLAPRMRGRHDLRWLSMGTSQDAVVAVEEGATHVRLGRILYGGME